MGSNQEIAKEPGVTFVGTCKSCEKETSVRFLKQYPRIGFNNQNPEPIGPYDRYCAYKLKFGRVPIFYSQPKGFLQDIYRTLTHLEIPKDPNPNPIMIRRIINTLLLGFIYSLLLILISPLPLLIFIPLTMSVLPMFAVYLLGLPGVLIISASRFIQMISVNPGKTKTNNFELFWEGKISRQDIHLNFYIRKILLYSPVPFVFLLLLKFESTYNEFFTGSPDESYVPSFLEKAMYSLDYIGVSFYFFLSFFLTIMFISWVNMLGTWFAWDKYTAMPKDVHMTALERKREEIANKETKVTKKEKVIMNRNPLSIFSFLLPSNQSEKIDFLCQICKNQVNEVDRDVYCDNCSRYFHRPHIITYLRGLNDENKLPICPVCHYDAETVFSEINWNSN